MRGGLVELDEVESLLVADDLVEESCVRVLEADNLEDLAAQQQHLFRVEHLLQRHEGEHGADRFDVDSFLLAPDPLRNGYRVVAHQPEHNVDRVVFAKQLIRVHYPLQTPLREVVDPRAVLVD